MTETLTNDSFSKSKGLVILEHIIFVLCLCAIAMRATFTEGIDPHAAAKFGGIASTIYSLGVSGMLILLFLVWFVVNYSAKKFRYRFTNLEIGICIFIIGSIFAGTAAANKRLAITNIVTLIAPIAMAIVLVQTLNCRSRIKMLLYVIAALGIVSTYQCYEQIHWNDQQIKFYQQDPEAALSMQGIRTGTLRHWQYEHRLYSKDIKGFFTTSNSAGSFAILASFAAAALVLEKFKKRKSNATDTGKLLISAAAGAAVILGLLLTKSKGAIAAASISAIMFVSYLCFGNWLKKHRRAVITSCLMAVLIVAAGVIYYGLTYDKLPGGNSMLVRWQYWRASAEMYTDFFPNGVGPGNFAAFYTHYKPPAALETVSDPHNFLLSMLTQYGLVGFIGFIVLFFIPLSKVIDTRLVPTENSTGNLTLKTKIILLTIVSAAMLFLRPLLIKMPHGGSSEQVFAASIILYLMPVIVFIAGFVLLTAGENKSENRDITIAAMFCGIIGVLIHNLIDFAIFEPGVYTTLWAVMACLIAANHQAKAIPYVVQQPKTSSKLFIAGSAVILTLAYVSYVFVPVVKAGTKVQKALTNPENAHQLLTAAAEDDPLDPTALNLNGIIYLRKYQQAQNPDSIILEKAVLCFKNAIERSPVNFKFYENLADTYIIYSNVEPKEEDEEYLTKAFKNMHSAITCYPGSARLWFKTAQLSEKMQATEDAITQYQKAIKIEDDFRTQFQTMYPDYKIFSRLGDQKYDLAKQRIEELLKKEKEEPTQAH